MVRPKWFDLRLLALAAFGAALILAFLSLDGCRDQKEKVARVEASKTVTEAQAESAREAIGVIEEGQRKVVEIERRVVEGRANVARAPGAAASVGDDVDTAGRRAICMFDAASDLAECRELLGPSAEQLAREDAERAAAGRENGGWLGRLRGGADRPAGQGEPKDD